MVDVRQLALLLLLDGSRRLMEVQQHFARLTGEIVLSTDLHQVLETLARNGYLDGEHFEDYYRELLAEYRTREVRPLRDPDGFGAPRHELRSYLDSMVAAAPAESCTGRLRGLVAPHLDYARGAPCYGAAYALLAAAQPPERVVILGTNHFGRSRSVVGTDRDFETPWGVVRIDTDFARRLAERCGGNLAPFELDHLREHSIELHAVWLHHVLGDGIRIVPYLCPDPSGPGGTAPGDPHGVDLRVFADALGGLLEEDPAPTLVVASADLSHVGRYFGDEWALEPEAMVEVRGRDEAMLAHLEAGDPEGMRAHMAATGNPTRVCSVGCLYALGIALQGRAAPRRLGYHQAVTQEVENAVSCCAYAYVGG